MIYDIKLRIAYDYASPAVGGRHVVCAMPLDVPGVQRVVAGLLKITPEPDERIDRVDFFGNRVTEFAVRAPHDRIAVNVQARVERLASPDITDTSPRLAQLADHIADCTDLGPAAPVHFTATSVRAPLHAAITAFARHALRPDMTATEAVLAIGHALYHHVTFDADATTVDTPAIEAFEKRHGVCQDFSHIMISALRGIGIPAGYVSGFLRTLPPPGKPRLEGADAMHAWVRAWCGPVAGWVAFDPTNDTIAGLDHIVVAYGRDYSDVAPIKGIMRAAGRQKSRQAVDVIPVK